MSALPQARVSPEEYLEYDRASEFRNEYHDGIVYAMSGGSFAHALIMGNASGELRQALRKQPCSVAPADARVRAAEKGPYFYPDVIVVCGPPCFADDQRDTLLNPVLVAEVLSPSTEAYDRGSKFSHYRQIDSLKEYLLISQTEHRIEAFRRQPDQTWLFTEVVGLDAVYHCESVDCSLALADVYDKVALA